MLDSLIDRLTLLSEVFRDPETERRMSLAAANAVIPEYKQRIFREGLASDGSLIGTYSKSPFYVNPNNETLFIGVPKPKFKPEGKYGQTVFKNGKPHKTKYLANGYLELRNSIGRVAQNSDNPENVNLDFSSTLRVSIDIEPRGNSFAVTYTDPASADIMEYQEVRFGKTIHEPTAEEREAGTQAARLELEAILEEIDG